MESVCKLSFSVASLVKKVTFERYFYKMFEINIPPSRPSPRGEGVKKLPALRDGKGGRCR